MGSILSKRISGKHKNNKLTYYIIGYLVKWFYSGYKPKYLKTKLKSLNQYNLTYIEKRVNYYNKLFRIYSTKNSIPLSKFKYIGQFKTYYLDFLKFKRYFSPISKIHYEFGDVIHIPKNPTIVKSRPISSYNENSVLLNLNKIRHFTFVKDSISFTNKINQLVWRGKITKLMPHREAFFNIHQNNSICNIGAVNNYVNNKDWIKPRLTIEEQLQYKFILSIEGNDVATNLKWIMSSNSVAVMTKPKYETWFMEGTLIPNYHYICIKDDYSDLNERLEYYINNPDKTLQIIQNANKYVEQFKNKKQEKLIALLVLKKYFDLSSK
ncbi:glycosyl transferase family 90 [Plebeiibacterium sediminum]|uniref:Glycosyl transferase family 90 n=1 Tax=Plebeiibacterium sediminum TaxID=2992112 RepID=A0AAE3M1M6_9BACT|nr:glycosyl transferase family 90 [Plebeiobacterium sediminum]MCW3785150.1 glycosyl transferase family 90 [Plebeiobacterium sediminum]